MATGHRILIVDDEPGLRRLYHDVLVSEGYRVKTAASADEALHLLDEFPPDLVVLDIRMPFMDGLEAMGLMLAWKSDLPIVPDSAYRSYKDNFCSWPASAYLVKSADTSELTRTLRALLDTPKDRVPDTQAA